MNWKFLKIKQYENIAIIRNNNIYNIGNICVGKRLQPTKHKAKRTTKTRKSRLILDDSFGRSTNIHKVHIQPTYLWIDDSLYYVDTRAT